MRRFAVHVMMVCGLLIAGCGSRDSVPSRTESKRKTVHPKAEAFIVRGDRAMKAGNYASALALADSAEKYAPGLADVPFLRGLLLAEIYRYEEARVSFERVLELDPEYEDAHFNLGLLAFQMEEYEYALEQFEAERGVRKTAEALVQLGRTLERLGRLEAAREAYEEAAAPDSASAAALAHLSQLHENAGRSAAALKAAKKAFEIDSTNADYRYLLGYQLYQSGRWKEAARLLRDVVEARPAHQGAHFNLGQTLLRLGRREEAQKYLARVDSLQVIQSGLDDLRDRAETHAEDPMQWVHLGNALYDSGRMREAERAYQVAVSLAPWSMELRINHATLTIAAGDTARGIMLYKQVLADDSTQADAWFNLGVVYADRGETEAARIAWNRALQIRQNDSTIKEHLEDLEPTHQR